MPSKAKEDHYTGRVPITETAVGLGLELGGEQVYCRRACCHPVVAAGSPAGSG